MKVKLRLTLRPVELSRTVSVATYDTPGSTLRGGICRRGPVTRLRLTRCDDGWMAQAKLSVDVAVCEAHGLNAVVAAIAKPSAARKTIGSLPL